MSQFATRETCPRCGRPAVVTWLGIEAYGHPSPAREEAISLDCPGGCYFDQAELAEFFPPTVRTAAS